MAARLDDYQIKLDGKRYTLARAHDQRNPQSRNYPAIRQNVVRAEDSPGAEQEQRFHWADFSRGIADGRGALPNACNYMTGLFPSIGSLRLGPDVTDHHAPAIQWTWASGGENPTFEYNGVTYTIQRSGVAPPNPGGLEGSTNAITTVDWSPDDNLALQDIRSGWRLSWVDANGRNGFLDTISGNPTQFRAIPFAAQSTRDRLRWFRQKSAAEFGPDSGAIDGVSWVEPIRFTLTPIGETISPFSRINDFRRGHGHDAHGGRSLAVDRHGQRRLAA